MAALEIALYSSSYIGIGKEKRMRRLTNEAECSVKGKRKKKKKSLSKLSRVLFAITNLFSASNKDVEIHIETILIGWKERVK